MLSLSDANMENVTLGGRDGPLEPFGQTPMFREVALGEHPCGFAPDVERRADDALRPRRVQWGWA